VTCLAPDEASATALTNQLQLYFEIVDMFLIPPPWASVALRNGENHAAYTNAWRTYQRIQADFATIDRDPKYRQLMDEFLAKSGKKTQAARERTLEEIETVVREFNRRKLSKLKEDNREDLDIALIDIYLREPPRSDFVSPEYQGWRAELGLRLGKAPETAEGLPATESGWYSMKLGSVRRQGVKLYLDYLLFRRTDLGLPALVEFLCSKSCSDVRYALQDLSSDEDN
jgi:hypothetical protein